MTKEQFIYELSKVVDILEKDSSWDHFEDLEFSKWVEVLDSIYFQEVD